MAHRNIRRRFIEDDAFAARSAMPQVPTPPPAVQAPSIVDLGDLDGDNGFTLTGSDAGDLAGLSVASAGDVNGDGIADLIVGAFGGDPGGDEAAGESYVVFGTDAGFPATLSLAALDGSNGFRIAGIDDQDRAGTTVAAGDFNDDGFADLIVGAPGDDPGGVDAGSTYMVFGKASFGATVNLANLNGANGFRFDGTGTSDQSGLETASGDVNGDGFADLIVGAPYADPGGDSSAGQVYVVFGAASGIGSSLDANALTGANGSASGASTRSTISARRSRPATSTATAKPTSSSGRPTPIPTATAARARAM